MSDLYEGYDRLAELDKARDKFLLSLGEYILGGIHGGAGGAGDSSTLAVAFEAFKKAHREFK